MSQLNFAGNLAIGTLRYIEDHVNNSVHGWKAIITHYKEAVEKAKNNKYFSLEYPIRIFLEISTQYSSPIFLALVKASVETKLHFQGRLEHYLKLHGYAGELNERIQEFSRYDDIYEELLNYILAGEKFEESSPLEIEGYTAKRLVEEASLSPIEAFDCLIFLKEAHGEVLAQLKEELPKPRRESRLRLVKSQ